MMSDYCVAENETFSDIASSSRPEGETAEAKSKKLCDKAQVECFSKLLNFANLKRFQFSSEHCTQDAATLTHYCLLLG